MPFKPEIGTIVTRNDRDRLCFRNAAVVAAPDSGFDPAVLVFPEVANAG